MDHWKKNILFSSLTTLGIGGPIKYFFEATSQNDLIETLKLAKANNIPTLIIGGGSNILVSDEGFDGLVIKNSVIGLEQTEDSLIVKAGTKLQDLVKYTVDHNLAGLYKLVGIPGSVGGAIYGKIAAYGDDITDYLESVSCFNGQEIITLLKDECEFAYRNSIFKKNKFPILSVTFKNLPPKEKEFMLLEQEKIMQKRNSLYPPEVKCPGSFFKNIKIEDSPADIIETLKKELSPELFTKVENNINLHRKIPVGALLEQLGAKGFQMGRVKVANNHGNTFINLGGATAKQYYDLAKNFADKAKEKFGVSLEPEVQLIGLPSIN